MFRNVSFFADKEYGVSRVNLDILLRKKHHVILENRDKLNSLLGLFEKRYKPDTGTIYQKGRLFVQSDRLILGDKVYKQIAGKWLALHEEFFYFANKRRSKSYFVDLLRAKHIRHFPIYKLKGEDRLKFALLSLTFQESGLMLISKLLVTELSEAHKDYLEKIISDTHCTLCLFTSNDKPADQFARCLQNPSLLKTDLTLQQ